MTNKLRSSVPIDIIWSNGADFKSTSHQLLACVQIVCQRYIYFRLAIFSGWQETILSSLSLTYQDCFLYFLQKYMFSCQWASENSLPTFFSWRVSTILFHQQFFINECRYFYFVCNDFFHQYIFYLTMSVKIYIFSCFYIFESLFCLLYK